jgi:tetratricopeptide (TPR) repeat protein
MTTESDKLIPRSSFSCRVFLGRLFFALTLVQGLGFATQSFAQGARIFTLFGDIKLDETNADEPAPLSLDVFLYKSGNLIGRLRVGTNDRYRFNNLTAGTYEVSVEIDGKEVARVSKLIAGQLPDDVRLDLNLGYRKTFERKINHAEVISVADSYPRNGRNKTLHQRSIQQIAQKNYDEAIEDLHELVTLDPKDYPAWFELGVVYFIRKEYEAAERCFVSSAIAQPSYLPATFNLGRVRLARKNFEGAIDAFEKTVKLDSRYAEAFYFLGETYLQLKKGSFAVGYFEQALKLDPTGMAEAHLRLASLYDQAGYKNLAAAEYENFLRKNPEYSQRRKLEVYIAANKGKSTRQKP